VDGQVGRSGRLEWLRQASVFPVFSLVLSLSSFFIVLDLVRSFLLFSR
jgi:hypothetical protein